MPVEVDFDGPELSVGDSGEHPPGGVGFGVVGGVQTDHAATTAGIGCSTDLLLAEAIMRFFCKRTLPVQIRNRNARILGSHQPPRMAPPTTSSALAVAGNTTLSLEVRSADDLQRLARLFSASGLFGRGGNPDAHMAECAIKILAGMEAGFGPFASAAGVSVINGKPGFGANLLAQAIKRHPVYDYRVLEKTDQVCRIKFLAGREELGVETFTIQMAERAGLVKGGPWKAYPEAMLFARCLSAGMRTHCPDALGGATAYTPEELGASGEIDQDGAVVAVTVTEEPPARDQLQAQALSRLKAAGLNADGMRAMLNELGGPGTAGLGQLSDEVLGRLARKGASAETVARWNAVTEPEVVDPEPADEADDLADDPDDLPAAWAA